MHSRSLKYRWSRDDIRLETFWAGNCQLPASVMQAPLYRQPLVVALNGVRRMANGECGVCLLRYQHLSWCAVFWRQYAVEFRVHYIRMKCPQDFLTALKIVLLTGTMVHLTAVLIVNIMHGSGDKGSSRNNWQWQAVYTTIILWGWHRTNGSHEGRTSHVYYHLLQSINANSTSWKLR